MVPNSVTLIDRDLKLMNKKREYGFSLIELLLVVTILAIVAALAIPSLMKAARATENGAVWSIMRTISSSQASFFAQNNRWARITEINDRTGNTLGVNVGDKMIRGKFTYEMFPQPNPTDENLRQEYMITAVRMDDTIYKFELNQSGEIEQVLP